MKVVCSTLIIFVSSKYIDFLILSVEVSDAEDLRAA
jgi:hypothetical protein